MNRRDLLKYFAVGTVIAPVTGAAPLAKLIEVPKIEVVEAKVIPGPINLADVKSVSIQLYMVDGQTRHVNIGDFNLMSAKGKIPMDTTSVDIQFTSSWSPPTVTGFVCGRVLSL